MEKAQVRLELVKLIYPAKSQHGTQAPVEVIAVAEKLEEYIFRSEQEAKPAPAASPKGKGGKSAGNPASVLD